MGESQSRYCGVKWTVQFPKELADKAEIARRLTGKSRQELLQAALEEYVTAHADEWRNEFQSAVMRNAEN